jgi:hypothetical protein
MWRHKGFQSSWNYGLSAFSSKMEALVAVTLSATAPTPRWFKLIHICNRLDERVLRGAGDKMRQRRNLVRLQKFQRMRREECPSLIGRPA